jgi:hypothetical protein
MKKIIFDKNELIHNLKKEIENLEKTDEDKIDYHKVSEKLIDVSLSPLKSFQDVSLLTSIEKMDEKISNMDKDETIGIKELVREFLPEDINEPFFNKEEDKATLTELRTKPDLFTLEITSKAMERFGELLKEHPISSGLTGLNEKENLELKAYLEVGFEKSIYTGVYEARDFIQRETKDKNFDFDYDNLSRGELKAIRNGIVEREDYSIKDILKDLNISRNKEEKEIEY